MDRAKEFSCHLYENHLEKVQMLQRASGICLFSTIAILAYQRLTISFKAPPLLKFYPLPLSRLNRCTIAGEIAGIASSSLVAALGRRETLRKRDLLTCLNDEGKDKVIRMIEEKKINSSQIQDFFNFISPGTWERFPELIRALPDPNSRIEVLKSLKPNQQQESRWTYWLILCAHCEPQNLDKSHPNTIGKEILNCIESCPGAFFRLPIDEFTTIASLMKSDPLYHAQCIRAAASISYCFEVELFSAPEKFLVMMGLVDLYSTDLIFQYFEQEPFKNSIASDLLYAVIARRFFSASKEDRARIWQLPEPALSRFLKVLHKYERHLSLTPECIQQIKKEWLALAPQSTDQWQNMLSYFADQEIIAIFQKSHCETLVPDFCNRLFKIYFYSDVSNSSFDQIPLPLYLGVVTRYFNALKEENASFVFYDLMEPLLENRSDA